MPARISDFLVVAASAIPSTIGPSTGPYGYSAAVVTRTAPVFSAATRNASATGGQKVGHTVYDGGLTQL